MRGRRINTIRPLFEPNLRLVRASADYPTALAPKINWNFARDKVLDPRITFTRASGGGYFNAANQWVQAAANEPRWYHTPGSGGVCEGLLLEPAMTNFATYSEDISQAVWPKVNSTAPATQTIHGNIVLTEIRENLDVAVGHAVQRTGIDVTSGTSYAMSAIVRRGAGNRNVRVQCGGATYFGTNTSHITINLSTGAVINTGSAVTYSRVIPLGDNTWRVSVVAPAIATGAAVNIGTVCQTVESSGNALVFDGDGVSSIWYGAVQFGPAIQDSSYIKTVAAPVTRAEDSALITGTNFSSWFNPAQGTIYAESYLHYSAQWMPIYELHDGTSANRIGLRNNGFAINLAGVSEANIAVGAIPALTKHKSACRYGTNDVAGVTGVLGTVSSDVAVNLPAPGVINQLRLLQGPVVAQRMSGTLGRFTYWDRKLSNEQLLAASRLP